MWDLGGHRVACHILNDEALCLVEVKLSHSLDSHRRVVHVSNCHDLNDHSKLSVGVVGAESSDRSGMFA